MSDGERYDKDKILKKLWGKYLTLLLVSFTKQTLGFSNTSSW